MGFVEYQIEKTQWGKFPMPKNVYWVFAIIFIVLIDRIKQILDDEHKEKETKRAQRDADRKEKKI